MSRFHASMLVMMCLFPSSSLAGVSLSEIAWMGTEVSPSNEWIELRNDSSEVISLDGWTLRAKDGSPSFLLSGIIVPNGYYLIERTDDETVPGIPADLVTSFGKGISNDGETLELRDGSSTIIDTVTGGAQWKSVGGDVKTKMTPQKREGIWVTAKPTPRSAPLLPSPSPLVSAPKQPPLPMGTNTSSLSTVKLKTPIVSSVAATVTTSSEERSLRETSVLPLERIYGEEPPLSGGTPGTSSTLLLLGTLLLFGTSVIVYLRGQSKTEAEKYEIIEDESEDLA